MNDDSRPAKAPPQDILPYFLRLFLPLTLLLVVAALFYAALEGWYEKQLIQSRQQQQVDLSQEALRTDIASVIREIGYLHEVLEPYIVSSGRRERRSTEEAAARFARHIQRYDQIRWLDLSGMERLRIDHRDGTTSVVPQDALQDKSSRYYFTEAIRRRPGELYISPLDLNIEHGEVEVPHRPMLRIARVTADAEGRRNGILLFNYQASRMLQSFAASRFSGTGELYLLNTDGYWLYASDESPTWGFMFGRDERLQDYFPKIWQSIEGRARGSFECERGLFCFTAVRNSIFEVGNELSGGESQVDEYKQLERELLKWIVVAFYPDKKAGGIYLQKLSNYLPVVLMIWVLLALASWLRGRYIFERNNLTDRLALHAKVMATATNGVMITDTRPTIVAVNEAFTALTGYREEEVIGNNPALIASGRHDEAFYREMWQELELRGHWEGEIWNRHKSGELYPEWLSISAIYDHDGNLSNYIGIFSVLAEQQGTEERLRELANTDVLTGLINRNLFYDRMEQALALSRREGSMAALLFIDLDSFKPINDTLGHIAGDTVLKTVAQRLRASVRETDTVARFGGDEFVVLLTSVKDSDSVLRLAENLIRSVSGGIEIDGELCHVGASVGVCLYRDENKSAQELMHCADKAMYRAKERGKGCVEVVR